MIEPHLEVSLPATTASLVSSYRAGNDDADKVVVLEQVFGNEQNQTFLRDICIAMHQKAGVRLALVEGQDGPVSVPQDAQDIPRMMHTHFEVSAGVLAAAHAVGGQLEIVGVDDLNSHQVARRVQQSLAQLKPAVQVVFQRISRLLGAVQRHVYPTSVLRMQRSRLGLYGLETNLRRRFAAVRYAARATRVDLVPFRLMLKTEELALRERSINQQKVRAEQSQFTSQLLHHFHHAWEQVVQKRNLKSFLPYLEFWRRQTGRSVKELEAQLSRGLAATLQECRFWLEAWLAASASEAYEGAAESGTIIEEFMRLALLADVPYFHLRHFRRAVAEQRATALIGTALTHNLGQIHDCSEPAEAIISALADTRAATLGRVEEQFELRRRALLLELVPLEAASLDIHPGDLARLAGELSAIGVGGQSDLGDDWGQVDAALAQAGEFYRACLARSAHMAAQTLRIVRQRSHDRAVLAVGGFHPDVVCRQFELDRGVSFSVVRPTPSL